jgi:hypothetical protein
MLSFFKKFLRAGILKNKFFTLMEVPTAPLHDSRVVMVFPSLITKVPNSLSSGRVLSSTCATAEMAASASPLKPLVIILNKSSKNSNYHNNS